jgi:hypothetical protein
MSANWKGFCVLLAVVSWMWAARSPAETPYRTKNVIIVSMDGVRYSETFGDRTRELIPNVAKLEKEGTLFAQCFNTGVTITRQGHSTIATGTWQDVPLGGPRQTMPAVGEYARNELGWGPKDCWVIFGKGMYSYAHYSSFPTYGEKYAPSFVIAIGENNIEDDKKVLAKVLEVMDSDKPRLMFINFGVTDHTAHSNKWELYTEAIQNCDQLVGQLWQKVQATPGYKDATTLVFTTDHGRHSDKPDQLKGGFASHGDSCPGCQHIFLLILGPDSKRGAVVDRRVLQVDIAPTVGELLGFQTPLAEGSVLTDAFVECRGVNKKLAKTPEAEQGLRLLELSKRDLLATIADANLKRERSQLTPSLGTEMLMRGMLRAAEVTKKPAYREFVEAWAKQHLEKADKNPCVARVLAELAAGGEPAKYLAAAKGCAENLAQGSSQQGDIAGLLARVAELTKDPALAKAAEARLGLEGKTEKDLLVQWRTMKLRVPPMACDFGPKPPPEKPAAQADVLRFMALADAARALPEDRVVRLALNLQQAACARGVRELGGVLEDPIAAALCLAQVLDARKINRRHPVQWTELATAEDTPQTKAKAKVAVAAKDAPKPQAKPKAKAAVIAKDAAKTQAKAKRRAAQPGTPLWTTPEDFFKYSFPYSCNLLKYKVSEDGHYASGDVLADGAALLLCAAVAEMPARTARGPSQVAELPAVPKDCTRVLIEFGRHKERRLVRWKGRFTVDGGEIVAMHPYSFEGEDKLDARAHSFDCTAGPATDGVVLDIRGSAQTAVKMTAEPQGMTFTLGELLQKKTIQVAAPGDQLLQATIPQN